MDQENFRIYIGLWAKAHNQIPTVFLRAKNVEEICRGKEGCWNVGKVDCKFGVE
jgi:hypothetical protein